MTRYLQAVTFLSSFDRMLIAPLLPLVAADLGVPVAVAAAAATSYFVGYGVMQFGWGIVSDRIGRVATMRLSLVIAGLAACASALAPTLGALVLLRALTGAGFAAVVPGSLIYLGDTLDVRHRQRPLTDIMRAMAVGMALATVAAAAIAEVVDWRATFAVPGVLALAAAAAAVLPEPLPGPAPVRGASAAADPHAGPAPPSSPGRPTPVRSGAGRVREVVRSRWGPLVCAFVFVEGIVILGALPLLPAVLQEGGTSVVASGLVVAGYGAAMALWTPAVKSLVGRVPAHVLMAVGAVLGVAGNLLLVLTTEPWSVLLASVLLAGTWSFLHSTMQTWATEVVPQARAAMISLFATALFLGSAIGTAAGSALLGADRVGLFFGLSAAGLAILGAVVVPARRSQGG